MSILQNLRTVVALACALSLTACCSSSFAAPPVSSPPVRVLELRAKHYDRYFSQLDDLIKTCDNKGQTDAVAELRLWQTPVDGEALLGRPLPTDVLPEISPDLPAAEREWRVVLKFARETLAKELYQLSRDLVNLNRPSFAWSVLREVLHFDSDHKQARTLLGFARSGDEWMSPFAAKKLKAKQVWHDRFGWLPIEHVKRYDNGERFYEQKWMTKEREESIRRDIRKAWVVETDHYKVKTNVSLERGVELAKSLEVFHQYFHNTFAAFFNTPEQLMKQFAPTGTSAAKPSKQFLVTFFRSKDEYISRLKEKNSLIEITRGIYMTDDLTAYFFDHPDVDTDGTLFHEATHQLLYELHSPGRSIGAHEHFWIVEGIACYMESFRIKAGGISIGDPKYLRFQAAAYRALEDKPKPYYVPLARFTSMSMLAYQTDPSIEKNYSQASGLVHFFMHADNGRYRDALISHLELLYRPQSVRGHLPGLDQLTGVAYEELDRQYIEHLKSFPQRAETD